MNKNHNFRKANFPVLYRSILQIDWSSLNNYNDINSATDQFYKLIYDTLDLHVHQYKICKHRCPRWFPPEIINLIKFKINISRKIKKTGNPFFKEEFVRLRLWVKRQISVAYDTYTKNVQDNILSNPQVFGHLSTLKPNRLEYLALCPLMVIKSILLKRL